MDGWMDGWMDIQTPHMFPEILSQHLFCSSWQFLFLPVYLWWQFCAHIDPHTSTPSTLALATQSNKHSSLLWNSLQHGDWLACIWLWWAPGPEKTTSWNYLSAPSYSVFIVLASCPAAARQPGCFSWKRWLLAAAPPLATSLSAPSSSVFIVSGRGAGAAELAAAWAFACLCCISSAVDLHKSAYVLTTCYKMWSNPLNPLCVYNWKLADLG